MTLALEFPVEWADDLASSNKTVTHQLYETLNIGDETSAVSGDTIRKIKILDKVWVPKEQLDSETFRDVSRTSPQDFNGVFKITFEYLYDPPYTIDEIEDFYPEKAEMLLKDPIHRWRAETGIELIHKEPDIKELNRIWQNWQLMPEDLKKISDQKSLALFNISNKDHYDLLVKKYRVSKIVSYYLKQAKQMNLLTNYDDTLLAMAEVEGADFEETGQNWLDLQFNSGAQELETSAKHALSELKRKSILVQNGLLKSTEVGPIITGAGGWHKWDVLWNGEVTISKFVLSPKKMKKVKELGFRVV